MSSHLGPAVLEVIDLDQFGAIPKLSTTQALEAMDCTGAAVRVVLFDYRKAFVLIDHGILVQKILSLSIPRGMAQWVINFLTSGKQRVKLSSSCYSDWELTPAGVSQGTKLGPWLFLLMINDLRMTGVPTWKYVDDTTTAEISPREKGQLRPTCYLRGRMVFIRSPWAPVFMQSDATECSQM